jgi:hypothetical protein
MTARSTDPETARREKRGWRHFQLTVAILAVTVGGWSYAVTQLGWVLQKEPVPWRKPTRVSSDFRLQTFPTSFGRYRMIEPNGETVLEDDIMDSLGIGRPVDARRLQNRRSNWYLIRRYEDTEAAPNSPYRFWQLELYYYTGEQRTVPHVPTRCLPAAGVQHVANRSKRVEFSVSGIPEDRPLWSDKPVPFQRDAYEATVGRARRSQLMAVYYMFCFNGEPVEDWTKVRANLVLPFGKYCYFSKIQFSPIGTGGIGDFEEADEAAAEFISQALPNVVKHFPSAQEVRALGGQSPSSR